MKKNLISTVALGMILSTTLSVHADNKVNDINGHWAHKEISQFIQNSYANGYEDNTFRPDNQITRAEFVKLVNKYFGFEDKGISNFKDINQKNWYYNDVCIAIKAGYINGYEDNTFRPNNLITREEAAKIIVSIKNQQDNTYDKLNTFPDKHLVSNWAKPYVEGAIENGYLKGDNLKNLRPTSRITRAESVTLLSRIENKKEKDVKPVVEENKKDKDVKPVVEENKKDNDVNPIVDEKNQEVDDNEYPDDDRYPINPDGDQYPNNDEHPFNPDDIPEPPYLHDKNYNGKPIIFMPEVEFNIARGSEWDNSNLDEVLKADAFDKNGKQLKVEYAGYVDTNVVGKYVITAMATDSEGRHSENEVVVFVRSSINRELLPSIEYSSKDVFLKLGDKFDYKMLGASAKDLLGNDISSSIEYSSKVDVNRPGRYPVVITATDSYGNSNSDVVVVYVQ